jgi:hypothetical protein
MIRSKIAQLLGRSAGGGAKLVVIAYDHAGHYFHELLGYTTAANALGISLRIIAAKLVDPAIAAQLHAERAIDSLPHTWGIHPPNVVDQLVAFADEQGDLASLWSALDDCDLGSRDMVLFPISRPLIIVRVGAWIARRASRRRPNAFFRFTGGELIDRPTGQTNSTTALFRLACSDLNRRRGQERVFLLADTTPLSQMMTRVCCRRAFPISAPIYHAVPARGSSASNTAQTVYVHLNRYSGRLTGQLYEIIRRVSMAEPSTSFILHSRDLSGEARIALESQLASHVDLLPAEQDTPEYFANISRSTIVLLAYDAEAYKISTSGVFVEAAGLGKVVVAPGATWMAEQMANGDGVGTTFSEPTADSVVTALLQALRDSHRLGALAYSLAPQVRQANSSERYIERMIALSRQKPDMQLIYQLGEEVDFSDAFNSHCFMRDGWGEIEDWGVWTIRNHAELTFKFARPGALVMRAFVQAFLTARHSRIDVRVSAGRWKVARWTFRLDSEAAGKPQWRQALIRQIDRGGTLKISFSIDAPTSPLAQGISSDQRTLGMGLRKLLFYSRNDSRVKLIDADAS